jgi:predicted dehydrogenase
MIFLAQIGVGYWGPNLLRNAIANPQCRVKTVSDFSPERQQYVKNLYPSIRVTDKTDEIFKDPEIDAVIIATPVYTHYQLTILALQAGKHVLVEKPMATTIQEIDHIASEAKKGNLVAMVGHTFIYNSAVRYVKDLIDQGEIGEIRYIYSQRLNLGRIRSDVDALWNFAPHDISIIQYWLDNPTPLSVQRNGIACIQPGIEDVVFLNITYPRQILAHIHVSWLDPRKIRQMVIVGSKKMVVYDDVNEDKIAIYDKGIDIHAVLGEHMDYDTQNPYLIKYRNGDLIYPQINFEEPLKLEIQHFLDCINDKIICESGPEKAREVINILISSENNHKLAT